MQSRATKKYTAADIMRYHNGSMSAAEMHALEKAALEDPFLSDALDGYTNINSGAKDVQALKRRLQKRTQKMYALPGSRRMVLSIAAVLILLAGFGWLATKLTNRYEPAVAVQTEAVPHDKQQAEITDSIANGSLPPVETLQDANAKKQLRYPHDITNKTAAAKPIKADSETFSNAHAAAPLSKAKNAVASRVISENVMKGRVIDEHSKAIPNATITDPQHNAVATTDSAGNFSIAAPDSQIAVQINSEGFLARQATLNPTDTGTTIMLQQAAHMPSKGVQLDGAEPREGWRHFNDYVNQNLVLTQEDAHLNGTKEVVLSFNVDANGNAVAISIVQSLCASCDSVAVRLIQKGGTWKKTKKSKATARISF